MKTISHYLAILTAAPILIAGTAEVRAADPSGNFSRTTFDLGVVVEDIDRSIEFYKEAIGFKELQGFKVPGDFCKEAGLTDGKPLDIHVLVLGEGETATRLKLMELPEAESRKSDNQYVHSQLGYSYITISIRDTDRALKRLKEAGATPVANGPVSLPEGFPEGVALTLVRDPDGNLIELVGPKQ